ncbi:uncharacterized protein LOC115590064 isoform X2 [Sparus aurata]|uniref:uncharacterized protein LOC115590064 isoform X2 n=1 Tax=Sparus aurata TaxID=8175 RepID=UPI0011C180B4|nr:uncharacterized protein LOC115590064 isoform X2 [Sparus aurata]
MGTMLGLIFLVLSAAVLSACEDTQKKPGDDVTLQCLVHTDGDITVMAWKHQSVGDVIVLRNNHSYESDQHPSVRGRVDHTYQDGVFTVILKNVTINDSGTYECVIGRRDGAPPVSIMSISLTVTGLTAGHTEEGGSEDRGRKEGGSEGEENPSGHSGLMVLIAAVVGISVSVISLLVYKRLMKKKSEHLAADEQHQLSSPEPVEVQYHSEV